MKKISLQTAFILLASVVSISHASPFYKPSDVEKFESTNICMNCDLSGPAISLDLNHSGATLDNSNLSNIIINYFNLSGASLKNVNFSGADLENANFSQADLTGAHFDGAYLAGANFYGAQSADLKNAYTCFAILPDGSRSAKCE